MNQDTIQLIGLAVLILAEQYAVAPWQFTMFARMWDYLANVLSRLSWTLGYMAMKCRDNYYLAVSSSGA